jgi:hypothetical protein
MDGGGLHIMNVSEWNAGDPKREAVELATGETN